MVFESVYGAGFCSHPAQFAQPDPLVTVAGPTSADKRQNIYNFGMGSGMFSKDCVPEMALELPSGADFKTNPVDLEGSRGQDLVVLCGFLEGFCFVVVFVWGGNQFSVV